MSTQVSDDFKKYGGSYLLSNNAYEDYVQGKDLIGRNDGQFMTPTNQLDSMLSNYPSNPREWERQLGLNEGSLGNDNIHKVEVYAPQDYEPRLPSSDLSGANDKFLDGGKLPGGLDECVINPFPNPESNPTVGRITNITPSIDNSQSTNENRSNVSSRNISYIGGGGANAPNNAVPTASQPVERGAKPHSGGSPSPDKSTYTDRGSKPTENSSNVQASSHTSRGEKPANTPQNNSNPQQTQRGTLPESTGENTGTQMVSSSASHNKNISNNSANSSGTASDQAVKMTTSKPNGMDM